MASPYEGYHITDWDRITEEIIAEHPLSEGEIVDTCKTCCSSPTYPKKPIEAIVVHFYCLHDLFRQAEFIFFLVICLACKVVKNDILCIGSFVVM